MAPSFVTIDTSSDIDFNPAPPTKASTQSSQRTLLLAPPSVASHEAALRDAFAPYDRAATELQMLDRLSAGLVTLPAGAYDLVLILTGADGAFRAEAAQLLGRSVFSLVVPALKAGGSLAAQDGSPVNEREAILAGLVADAAGRFKKPDYAEEEAVPLKFGLRKKTNGAAANGSANGANGVAHSSAGPAVSSITVPVAGKETTLDMEPQAVKPPPAGVGFSDDLDDIPEYESGDELIDEDDLFDDNDLARDIQQPPECAPQPGKRRRACKDCTCGLAERLQQQDDARRKKADAGLATLKLASTDLSEVDYTVAGKTGSCNSCSLGDAFRCADCPYIGLPAFRPGEEVKILNNVAQF